NDMRLYGNFAWRQDPDGNDGHIDPDRNESSINWLGALDVTATFYEIDVSDSGSTLMSKLGSTHVLSDGSYSFTYSDIMDEDSSLEIAIHFALSYDGDNRAFRIDDGDGTTYTYWHPNAT